MMTTTQLIAEVKNKLKTYDQQGLIDEISIRSWMKENIKELGGNIMEDHQQVLIVEKGKAKLPENFWSLKVAVKCEQQGYSENKKETHIQRRISYLDFTDIRDYYNYIEGKPCLEDGDSRYITETLFFETNKKSYSFYYDQPQMLNLKRHVNKTRCESNCPNLQSDSKYEISIDQKGNYISTNFNEGFIWIWYRGLPCDDYGDLIIPETSRDKLKNYVIYNSVVKTLEDIWLAEDDLNVQNKIAYFKNITDNYYYEAQSEAKNKGLQGWSTRVKNNNRRNSNKFERMYRSLDPNRPYGRGFTNSI